MDPRAEIKGIKLIVDDFSYLPFEAIGDEQRFMQVAINIISNAISNTQKGQVKVEVKYDSNKQLVSLLCQDTG